MLIQENFDSFFGEIGFLYGLPGGRIPAVRQRTGVFAWR